MEPNNTSPIDPSSLTQPLLLHTQLSLPSSSSTSTSSHHHPKRPKSNLHRANTAPAISVLPTSLSSPNSSRSPLLSSSILRHAFLFLLAYLSVGVTVYCLAGPTGFIGNQTNVVIDAVYFCIVTLCTIGYGDIAPATALTKAFSCLFVLVGFGLIDVLLSGAVSYMLDAQEAAILAGARGGVLVDAEKGRMRIRMKVALAVLVVILCIGVGTIAMIFIENLNWMDSLYLSVMSVTTVGYGDRAFKTLAGRAFASVWLLVSTLAVARAFLFLAEARIDRRHRRIAKWILNRDLTVEDLLAADINRSGFISKSEFVIYKLKEMGKIGEKDILLIINQFNKLDINNTGKITLPGLLNTDR
ncbi:Outward rectifying potassium channel protein [Rhynchospora pubera]|uniref:Outward rectifying potassium channel protein n=1 Tax=Rhynchospora pubera TaxID=906938 RepID=A0AAV8CIG8_9POAL|nr:Outward rectifying potassium channel protein [Rhynchospora pubera]